MKPQFLAFLRLLLSLSFLVIAEPSFALYPGDIITVAGGGVGDGVDATTANVYHPSGVTVDSSGNLYIAGSNRIRKVDVPIPHKLGPGAEGMRRRDVLRIIS